MCDLRESMGLEETDVTQEAHVTRETLDSVEDGIMENTPLCIRKRLIGWYTLL